MLLQLLQADERFPPYWLHSQFGEDSSPEYMDSQRIEPVPPCLQNNPRNIMWLILLAFTYVT
jgi:hypothetical protein